MPNGINLVQISAGTIQWNAQTKLAKDVVALESKLVGIEDQAA